MNLPTKITVTRLILTVVIVVLLMVPFSLLGINFPVYDVNGKLIEKYEGKFDVETDHDNYILFDDEEGRRHIIFYKTGTVIVDEK